MNANFIRLFNDNLHLMLGYHSLGRQDLALEGNWADQMLNAGAPIWDSWAAAVKDSCQKRPDPTTITVAVWGWDGNIGDTLQDVNTSTSGTISYNNLQVYP